MFVVDTAGNIARREEKEALRLASYGFYIADTYAKAAFYAVCIRARNAGKSCRFAPYFTNKI